MLVLSHMTRTTKTYTSSQELGISEMSQEVCDEKGSQHENGGH